MKDLERRTLSWIILEDPKPESQGSLKEIQQRHTEEEAMWPWRSHTPRNANSHQKLEARNSLPEQFYRKGSPVDTQILDF